MLHSCSWPNCSSQHNESPFYVLLLWQMFATAGSDTIVRVYDDTRTTPILHLTSGDGNHSCGHTNSVFGMAWKPDEDQVQLAMRQIICCISVQCFYCITVRVPTIANVVLPGMSVKA
eukprot:GHRR01032373.1.p1 GENE.GHRR01032373.1~~GHRR01032373.1.p1  ORF type:complete len:117 (+),score=29.63 GHRR01032373.1:195-545(+)